MNFTAWIPVWNSLDAVRRVHSDLELGAIVFFLLLAFFDALAHWTKDKKKEHVFGAIGIVFFFIAVSCEFAGYEYGQRNDELSEQVITSLDVKATHASDKAAEALTDSGKAITQAGQANTQSGIAVATASNANALSVGARNEADSLTAEVTGANQKAADAVSRLADAEQRLTVATQGEAMAEAKLSAIKTPRFLTNTDHLIAAMEPFKGTEFTINSFMDTESSNFALISAKALAAAGWIRKQPAGMNLGVPSLSMTFDKDKEIVPSCIDTGVSIHVPGTLSDAKRYSGAQIVSLPEQLQAGYALYQQLGAFIVPPDEQNVAVGLIDPRLSVGPITICVGKKP
jgi:hypothetical protein